MALRTDSRPRPAPLRQQALLPAALQALALLAGLATLPPMVFLTGRALEMRSLAALALLALATAIVAALLWSMHRLGMLIRRGEALSAGAAAALGRIGAATAFLGGLRALAGGWLVATLGVTAPRLSSPPGLPDLFLLLLCGVVWCAARSMAEGARLAEDGAHIV